MTAAQPMGSDTWWWWGSPSDGCPRPLAHHVTRDFPGSLTVAPGCTVASRLATAGKLGPGGLGHPWDEQRGGGNTRWKAAGMGGPGTALAPGRCLTRAGVRRQLPLLQLPLLGDAGSLPALAAGLHLASGEGTVCTGRQRGWHRRRGCARPTLTIAKRWGDARGTHRAARHWHLSWRRTCLNLAGPLYREARAV